MRNEIQCLLDWLNSNPSDEKAHRILRALAEESLKKSDLEVSKRKFTNKDIVAAAKEPLIETTYNKWVNWKNTVLPYWKAKKERIIKFAEDKGMTTYPELDYHISEKGGRGNESTYWLKAEPLPKINTTDKQNSEQEKNLSVIYYEKSGNGEIKPAWWVKRLFNNGQIRLSSWHIYVLSGWLFIVGISTVVLSYFIWLSLTIPKPITTQELTALISIFVFPYFAWLAFLKPWVSLFDDRIVPASENLIAFKEKSAQIELFRDGDLRLIRLVRYSASCPICGATIYLDKGEPDFPRRMVGRCNESPREHIYSFDRVTQKGSVLRMP